MEKYIYCRHYFMYANKNTFTVWTAMQIVETYELQGTKTCKVIKRKLTKLSDKFVSYKSIIEYLTVKKGSLKAEVSNLR